MTFHFFYLYKRKDISYTYGGNTRTKKIRTKYIKNDFISYRMILFQFDDFVPTNFGFLLQTMNNNNNNGMLCGIFDTYNDNCVTSQLRIVFPVIHIIPLTQYTNIWIQGMCGLYMAMGLIQA